MSVVKNDALPAEIKQGVTRKLIHGKDLMMAVIDFMNGPWNEPEPPHAHVHEQTTYVAEGLIRFFCEDEPPVELGAGDMFFVPSNRKHTIQLLSARVRLVDAFHPLRREFL